ncbi:MAG: hypothetical protein WA823_10535 [Candidatus Acidiferrales bacterium]
MRTLSLDETLIAVWTQALVDRSTSVKLGDATYPVNVLKAKRLHEVTFTYDGETFIAIEQNPNTKSRWAEMARSGKKVMQFVREGRYFAVVADGKIITYGKRDA